MKFFLATCCLVVLSIASWAQSRVVTGQVLGAQKDTIIGAIIKLKGTNVATTSDYDGMFSISVSDTIANPTLVVSYVGMKEKEIIVGTQSNVSVAMEDDSKLLDEVVVVGYGTMKKSDLTGSIASLKNEEIKQVQSGNVLDAIQGKAAGVDIATTSGETGKKPEVVIRGTRSITAGNDPLYIVDGVQYSNIQDINSNDILSMEVLKDASSTAIYGSRGSNGVIIVTTKKGAAGNLKVTFNSYAGVSSAFRYPLAMNGEEYARLKRAAFATNGITDDKTVFPNAEELSNLNEGISTDYVSKLLHKGTQQNYQVAISGGNEKMKTYFSLDYFKETGLLKNDNQRRYTGRLNIDYQVNKYFKAGTQTQITSYDQNKRTNPLGLAKKINPLTTPFDENGEIIVNPLSGKDINPLIDEQDFAAVNKVKTLRIFPTIYAEVTPLKGLSARTNFSVNWDNSNEGKYYNANSVEQGGLPSISSQSSDNKTNINWQGIINYTTTLKKDHSISLLGLSEYIQNKTEVFDAQGQDQLIKEQTYFNLGGNSRNIGINSYFKQSRLISFAGRANYSFKGRYLVAVTVRQDGASVLAEGKKWDFFPSLALGWRISDEKFMQFQKIFSTIKLRTSYGIAGNSQVDPYTSQSLLIRVPYAFDNVSAPGYALNPKIGNGNLTWEKSRTLDFGLDFGILKERITGSIVHYQTNTSDLLLPRVLPPSTGVESTIENIGKSKNTGWEFNLSSVNLQKKNLVWSTTVNFMRNREKVVELNGGLQFVNTGKSSTQNGFTVFDTDKPRYIVVGSPVNSFYDYEKIGIWQLDQQEELNAYNIANGTSLKPGDIRVKDQNGDGKITIDDRKVIGSTVPKFSAGINNEFKFFGFDLSFYIFARIGQTFSYNTSGTPTALTIYDPTGRENSLTGANYWTPENPTNDLPRPNSAVGAAATPFYSTINYRDGSFVKLRNITLGYTLSEGISKKLHISRMRIYVSAKNLSILYSKVKDYDPEMNGSLTFPTTRLIVGGINLEF